MKMNVFKVGYYEGGTFIEEQYEAQVEMQVRAYLNRHYKRKVKLEYIKKIDEVEVEDARY